MKEKIKKMRLYGSLGHLLFFVPVFLFIFKFVFKFLIDVFGLSYKFLIFPDLTFKFVPWFFFSGLILIFLAADLVEKVYKKPVFKNFAVSFARFLLSAFVFGVSGFLLIVLGIGFAFSDQASFAANIILLFLLILSLVSYFLIFYFLRRAYYLLYKATEQRLFQISAEMFFTGGVMIFISTMLFYFKKAFLILEVLGFVFVVLAIFLLPLAFFRISR